jgi:hypothetical protein
VKKENEKMKNKDRARMMKLVSGIRGSNRKTPDMLQRLGFLHQFFIFIEKPVSKL